MCVDRMLKLVLRRGLAPGSVCLFALQRAVRVPRTSGRCPIRHRLRIRGAHSTLGRGMGRYIVSLFVISKLLLVSNMFLPQWS